MASKGHALSRDALIRTLTAYSGITTEDGAGDGTTLVDSNLIGRNDFISGKTILIMSGDAKDEDKGAIDFDDTDGKIYLQAGFDAQIKAGTIFRVLNISSVETLIKNLTDGLISFSGTTTAEGGAGGSSLICSDLADEADFNGNQVVITTGDYKGQARDINGITTGGTVTPHLNFGGVIAEGTEFIITAMRTVPAEVAALAAALGNPTADMSAVTQSDAADLAAYLLRFKEHFRAHDQTRICLVVPDLEHIDDDAPNTAIKAELEKIGTVSVLDQTGVDGGQEDWDVYDVVVVGSDAGGYTFTVGNIDDLIKYHGPLMVCCSAVAEHLLMGTDTTQSASTVNEWCKTIYNRVMYLVFGAVGDQEIFSEPTVSDRLDMSAAALTEQLLMTSLTGDVNTTAVVGWLPSESADAETYELNDGSTIPSGRLFAGCFVHADKLTDLGTLLLRRLARNLTQGHLHPLTVNVKRAYQEDIPHTDFDLTAIDTALTADPPNADAVNSIVDIDQKSGRAYVLRSLWVNITSFGTGTQMTFQLWVPLNGTVTSVDSVVVSALGIQNLMDIFGLPEVHADGIWITAIVDAGDTGACEGTYRFGEAKK